MAIPDSVSARNIQSTEHELMPVSSDETLTISALDESELLAKIFPFLPTNDSVLLGPGDDCAVISAPISSFVVSTDILVQDVHFRTDWSAGYQIGWRAAMQNLADIAAMGAQPSSLVVGLGMPSTTQVSWVTEFARGLGDAARSVGAACVGGDLSGAPNIFISVTVQGDPVGSPVQRSQAKPGDVIAMAGHTGWSAAGYELLSRADSQPADSNQPSSFGQRTGATSDSILRVQELVPDIPEVLLALQTFCAPTAPVALGAVASRAGATAMMDISDGLIRDLQRICKASGVRASLDYARITRMLGAPQRNQELMPIAAVALTDGQTKHTRVCAQTQDPAPFQNSEFGSSASGLLNIASALLPQRPQQAHQLVAQWILTGGEDHGLLATFPNLEAVPEGFHAVGRIEEDGGESVAASHTQEPATQYGAVQVLGVALDGSTAGWDHFR